MTTTPRKDLPGTNAPNWNQRVTEELRVLMGRAGNGRALTARDLIDSGIAKPGAGGGLVPGVPGGGDTAPDLTPPPVPTGFAVTAGLSTVFVEHDAPVYPQGHGHDRTVVYGVLQTGSMAPTFDQAVVLFQFQGTIGAYPAALGTRYRLWIKWQSQDGVQSAAPAGGTNGLDVQTGRIANNDLGPLIVEAGNLANGAVSASKLAAQAVDATKFAAGIEPVSVSTAGALPTVKSTSTIVWQGKLYRWDGSKYSAAVPTVDLTGTIIASQIAAGAIDATKFASGIEPVTNSATASLPTVKSTTVITWQGKLYRWDGSKYTAEVAVVDLSGQIDAAKLADNAVTVSKIAAGAVDAGKLAAGAVTADKIAAAAVDTTKFASGIEPVTNSAAASLPTVKSTTTITWQGKLYRWDGSKYTAAVPTTDLTGTIIASQIAAGAIDATKFAAGIEPVTNSAAASLPTVKSTTVITWQGKLYRWDGSKYSAEVMVGDMVGQIAATQIADNAITTPKLAANAVVADKLAVNSVTANAIAADSVVVGKVAAGAINAREIAAGAITASKIVVTSTDAVNLDPFFQDSTLWTGPNYTRVAGSIGSPGPFALSTPITQSNMFLGSYVPIDIGRTYLFETWFKAFGATANRNFAAIRFFDVNGAAVVNADVSAVGWPGSNAPAGNHYFPATSTVAAQEWTRYTLTVGPEGIAKFPPKAAFFIVGCFLNYGGVAPLVESQWGGIRVTEMARGELVVDGSITASKMVLGDTTNFVFDSEFRDFSAWAVGAVQNFSFENGETADNAKRVASYTTPLRTGTANTYLGEFGEQRRSTIEPGRQVFVSVKIRDYLVAEGRVDLGVVTTKANGTTFSNVLASRVLGTADGYVTLTATYVVAADDVGIGWRIRWQYSAAGRFVGPFKLMNPVIRVMGQGELIVDGAISALKIAAGAVTANAIAANAVTANAIAANSITTAKIAAGAVNADQIAAKAITVEKLFVALTDNLIANSTFDNDPLTNNVAPSGWSRLSVTGADIVRVAAMTGANFPSARGLIFSRSAGSTGELSITPGTVNFDSPESVSGGVLAQPGDEFLAEWWAYQSGIQITQASFITVDSAGTVSAVDVSLTPIANTTVYGTTCNSNQAAGVWAKSQVAVRYTGNTTKRLYFRFANAFASTSPPSSWCYLCAPYIRRRNAGSLIIEGAITADKVAAKTLTAAQIAAGAITATELAAGAVTAGKIAAGSITATELAANSVTAVQLAALSVTAGKIAANSVTANEIAANSIVAGKIAAGAVNTAELAAGSVLASKLQVADTTNPYGDFDCVDPNYCTAESGSFVYSTSGSANNGKNIVNIPPFAGVSKVVSQWFSLDINAEYLIAQRISSSVNDTVGFASSYIELGSYSGSGAVTVTRGVMVGLNTTTSSGTFNLSVTTTGTERYGRIVYMREAGGTARAYFGAPVIRRKSGGNLIVDGAITASKMVLADTSNAYPDFDMLDDAGYSSTTAFDIISGSSNYGSKRVLRMLAGVAASADATTMAYADRGFQVEPNSQYLVSFQMSRINSGTAGTVQFMTRLGLKTSQTAITWDAPVAQVSDTTTVTNITYRSFTLSTGTRTRLSVGMQILSGAAAGGYLSAITIRKVNGGELIVDGAISASKLAVNAVTANSIAAGAVTANAIAANAVTANAIAANSITTAKIAAGAVGADQIAANAITTKHLTVADFANLIPDPDFAGVDQGTWFIANPAVATIARYTSATGNGVLITKLAAQTAEARVYTPNWTSLSPSNFVPVKPGDNFRVNCTVTRKVAGADTGLYAGIYAQLLNTDGTTPTVNINGRAVIPNAVDTAVDVTGQYTVPAGTLALRFYVTYAAGTGSGGSAIAITNNSVRRMNSSELIVDGAITATKLSANSIAVGTAAIQNGAIVNAMIGNAAIDGAKIAVAAIDSAKIANGAIQNAHIANAAIDNAKIANLSAAKITGGAMQVGSYINSANYSGGYSGWSINSDGNAEFCQVTVRGSIFSSNGVIGGININANGLNSGGFIGYNWPAAGQSGFHLGPNGLLLGNYNNGRYFQIEANGNIYAPGFSIINGNASFAGNLSGASGSFSGTLTAQNIVTTGNLQYNSVTTPLYAFASNSFQNDNAVALSLYVPAFSSNEICSIDFGFCFLTGQNGENGCHLYVDGGITLALPASSPTPDPQWRLFNFSYPISGNGGGRTISIYILGVSQARHRYIKATIMKR